MTTGKGGKTLNDRVLAADVRTLSLRMIQKYLNGDDEDFKKQLILKLASTVLPRINEISGPDGGNIPLPIANVQRNNIISEDKPSQ